MAWYKEMGGKYPNGNFGRGLIIENKVDMIDKQRDRFNNEDVYATAYSYDNKTIAESRLYGAFYLDFDDKIDDSYEKLKIDVVMTIELLKEEFGVQENQIELFFSGSKGFHLTVHPIVLGILPKLNLNEEYKKIATYLKRESMFNTIDTVIYDRVRLLRLNNSINSKSGLYKVQITLEQLRAWNLDQMKEWAKEPRPYKRTTNLQVSSKAIKKYKEILATFVTEEKSNYGRREVEETEQILPCTLLGLETECSQGGRNNMVVLLASSLFQAKQNLDEVIEVMLDWNDKYCNPKLPEREVIITVRSALQQVRSGRCYGCGAMRENNLCLGSMCRLFKKKKGK